MTEESAAAAEAIGTHVALRTVRCCSRRGRDDEAEAARLFDRAVDEALTNESKDAESLYREAVARRARTPIRDELTRCPPR